MTNVDIVKVNLNDIEWARLYRQLMVYASSLARAMPSIFDGVSPEDLVGETLTDFWASDNFLNWNPLQGTLQRFLCKVLKNKFLMHVRRHQLGPISMVDATTLHPVTIVTNTSHNTLAERAEQVKKAARGDKTLEDLVEAGQEIENGSNQQLSLVLNTTTEEVVNRKKRLIRRLDRGHRSHCGQKPL